MLWIQLLEKYIEYIERLEIKMKIVEKMKKLFTVNMYGVIHDIKGYIHQYYLGAFVRLATPAPKIK